MEMGSLVPKRVPNTLLKNHKSIVPLFAAISVTSQSVGSCRFRARQARIVGSHYTDSFIDLWLIRGFSGKSYVGQKFWKSIKHLKVAGRSLGILPHKGHQNQRRPNAIQGNVFPHQLPVSGSNTFQEDSYTFSNDLATFTALPYPYDDHVDGTQLSNELTILLNNIEPNPGERQTEAVTDHWGANSYENQTTEDVSRTLLSMF